MPSFDEDDDRDVAASPDGSSDNELDDVGREAEEGDVDAEGEAEIDGEGDGDGDGDGEADEDADSQTNGSQGTASEDGLGEPASQTNEDGVEQPSPIVPGIILPSVRPEMLTAASYDIVPTIAGPQSTSINTITATADTRWVFSGGSDGYIRRYNWVDSVNGKLMLTVAQRHPFVDSVVKAAQLMTYWENWDVRPRSTAMQNGTPIRVLSPVYSLAVQNQGLWLLAGTDSGTIRLQSIRHEESRELALLQQHTSAVSQLVLSSDEQSLLSGSWDKSVLDWDLNTGQVRTTFAAGTGQVSAIEARPISSVPVPQESGEAPITNGTYSSNNHVNGTASSNLPNGVHNEHADQPGEETARVGGSPDSLFGGDEGDDDLFGDSGGAVMTNGAHLQDAYGEDDDLSSHVLDDGPPLADGLDDDLPDALELQPVQPPAESSLRHDEAATEAARLNGDTHSASEPLVNGLPHAEDVEMKDADHNDDTSPPTMPTSDSTFLATSIDGTIRVWDRRQPAPVARMVPRNTPPWCLSACWSPDGNFIYAGRRNCTVEEYDLRKGLKAPERIFRFPGGSGPVTAVKAMPNGRHLVCASYDILRLYDLKAPQTTRSTVPFLIVPGHRTGVISQLYVDPACRFMISAGGNRGWEGASTEVLLGYEIGVAA